MKVLGIDPSSQSTGYGIIEFTRQQYVVLDYGTIKPTRKAPLHAKLREIKSGVDRLLEKHAPEEVAIENPFYARNIRTAITLGQVRGAVLVAVAESARPLFEYSPLEIKKAVTGYGQADKTQVATMVKALLNLTDDKMEEDASDALACAFCHLNTRLYQKNIEESEF
ncbi:MAG: crossover junction endodeoxyribonuclease RuvC [Candidatus Aminicenantales bacterium]